MRVTMSMTRKEFLGTVVKGTALGAVVATTVAACGGDDDGDDGGDPIDAPPGACTPRNVIAGNHGHGFTVTRAEVDAGVEVTYQIEGTAGHDHMVTLLASHMATLATGGTVMVVSTSGAAHTHNITVNCT